MSLENVIALSRLLVVDWVCYRFVTVKGGAYGGVYRLGFCGRACLEVWQGKPRLLVVSDHIKLTISNVSSCGVVPSFFIRWNEQFLKHSIKQCMLSVLGKINLFSLGRGEGSPPPLPLLATRLSMPLNVIKKHLHLINLWKLYEPSIGVHERKWF